MELTPTKTSPPQELPPPPSAVTVTADQEHARGQSPRPQNEERKDEQAQAQAQEGDQKECRTPISKESKLPSIASTCPPAPKKMRSSGGVAGCRRRVSEFDLFAVSAQEMERLFRRRDDQPTTATAASSKKRKWSSF